MPITITALGPAEFPVQIAANAATCTHPTAYVRLEGVAVCLACAATLQPGAGAWEPQAVAYCAPGLHQWGPQYADDHPVQCVRCPAVERREGTIGTPDDLDQAASVLR